MDTPPGNPIEQYVSELNQAPRVWVGLSGGLDSSLLLHLVAEKLPPSKIVAIHVNHGIHVDAEEWQSFCIHQCEEIGVRCETAKVSLDSASNFEERARELRYKVFEKRLGRRDLLLLAHHANDQAETILFRMMRGAGLRGLLGMPVRRPLGNGQLVRPLINLSKSDLIGLARQRKLEWVDDPSNENIQHSRNFLRHEIIPRLETRWPTAVERINRSAIALHDAAELLEQYAEELANRCDLQPAQFGVSLNLLVFNQLTYGQRQLVLRELLSIRGEHPETARLDSLLAQLEKVESDSQIKDCFQNVELRVFKKRLYLLSNMPEVDENRIIEWDTAQDLEIVGLGRIPTSADIARMGRLEVRFRSGGERAHPAERDCSQSLKKLMQEYEVPPWIRERSPLLYQSGELVAVAGVFSCVEGIATPRVEWRPE